MSKHYTKKLDPNLSAEKVEHCFTSHKTTHLEIWILQDIIITALTIIKSKCWPSWTNARMRPSFYALFQLKLRFSFKHVKPPYHHSIFFHQRVFLFDFLLHKNLLIFSEYFIFSLSRYVPCTPHKKVLWQKWSLLPHPSSYRCSRGSCGGYSGVRKRDRRCIASLAAAVTLPTNTDIPCIPSLSEADIPPEMHSKNSPPPFFIFPGTPPGILSSSYQFSLIRAGRKN